MDKLVNTLRLAKGDLRVEFTARNTANVDIIVDDVAGKRLLDLQVKARCKYKNWTLNRRHETIISDRLFYCLLAFDRFDARAVSCWIVPSVVIADCVRETHKAYLDQGEHRRDTARRHVREDMTNRLVKYGLRWLDPFKDRWDLLPQGVSGG